MYIIYYRKYKIVSTIENKISKNKFSMICNYMMGF